ncbi:hypothetical protein HK099_005894 [Clydaea vesicula]|uniref:Uncharacterized protein n=1 Tax=Clydaea vesicula TaxID=447962 RepID=A0AAD5TY76_9FUNG|nr:hypothetical protein HK099_005894 [Clydaea vesicula]
MSKKHILVEVTKTKILIVKVFLPNETVLENLNLTTLTVKPNFYQSSVAFSYYNEKFKKIVKFQLDFEENETCQKFFNSVKNSVSIIGAQTNFERDNQNFSQKSYFVEESGNLVMGNVYSQQSTMMPSDDQITKPAIFSQHSETNEIEKDSKILSDFKQINEENATILTNATKFSEKKSFSAVKTLDNLLKLDDISLKNLVNSALNDPMFKVFDKKIKKIIEN